MGGTHRNGKSHSQSSAVTEIPSQHNSMKYETEIHTYIHTHTQSIASTIILYNSIL